MDTGIVLLDDYGWLYIVFLALIVGGVVLNVISTVRVLKKGGGELRDYADVFIKYMTIAFMFIIGAWCIINVITPDYDIVTVLVHLIIGLAVIGDGIFSLIVKLKYKTKSQKGRRL